MKELFVILIIILSIDNSTQNQSEKIKEISVKTKRGIHYYALMPGKAVVHSYNVFTRPAIPTPVLYRPKSISPIYANRYPVFVHDPFIVQKPIVATIPAITQHFSSIPAPQHGWRPISSTVPNVHPNPTHLPAPNNNYYFPPSPSVQQDISFAQPAEQYHQQSDLQAHLEHLQKIQDIQHHFFRSEHNDGLVTSLSEQGYETASNNGRYAGPSSYDVHLNSRGRVN